MQLSPDHLPGPSLDAIGLQAASRIADGAPGPQRGILRLQATRHGRVVLEEELRNVITDGAKDIQARLIGGDVGNRSITQIGVGTGAGPALASNTGLTNALLRPITGVTYPAPGQVHFTFAFGVEVANGMAITEFGLFTAGGLLFARRVRSGPFFKDSDTILAGLWAIYY